MTQKIPTLFVSHGSPMLLIDKVDGQDYARWGSALGKPKAILVFSAHWETARLAFGETDKHNDHDRQRIV